MRKHNVDQRRGFGRYLEAAAKQSPPFDPNTSQPVMPVEVAVFALAKMHSTMQKKLDAAIGQERAALMRVKHLEYRQQKTQEYLQAMKGRLDQAASDGITVALFIEQDRERSRLHRSHAGVPGVYASDPED
jgi:hypothetical protein